MSGTEQTMKKENKMVLSFKVARNMVFFILKKSPTNDLFPAP